MPDPRGIKGYLPSGMHDYIPDDPLQQALASVALAGLAGGLYKNLLPTENPRAAISPREIRVFVPREEEEQPLNKVAMGPLGQMGLGFAAPIGAYGVYKAIEHYLERSDRSRLAQQAEYLRRISDPAFQAKEQAKTMAGMNRSKMASDQTSDKILDAITQVFLTKLSEDESSLARAQTAFGDIGELGLQALENYPGILGAIAGTSGLAAYLAAKRNLLPEDRMQDPVDVSDPVVVTPRHMPPVPQPQITG